jgi:hypothetical protein
MRTQDEFLLDLLRRLAACGVDYMLTGSMASNYWGIPRTTHDVDFVVVFGADKVAGLLDAFSTDMFIQENSVRAAFRPPHQFNVIDNQSALKADFWLLRDVPFDQAMFARRLKVTIRGTPAAIATPEDVIVHKLYWDSLTPSARQLEDAAGVYAVQGSRLDLAHIEHWTERLGLHATWARILSAEIAPKST